MAMVINTTFASLYTYKYFIWRLRFLRKIVYHWSKFIPSLYKQDLVFQKSWFFHNSRAQTRGFTNLKLNLDLWNQWINIEL